MISGDVSPGTPEFLHGQPVCLQWMDSAISIVCGVWTEEGEEEEML